MPKTKHTARKTTGCHRNLVKLAERATGSRPSFSRKTYTSKAFTSQFTPAASQQAPARDSEATSTPVNGPRYELALDLLSTSDSYVIQADAPGVAKSDMCIKLNREDKLLIMTGKRASSFTHTVSMIQHSRASGTGHVGGSQLPRHSPVASAAAGTAYMMQQRLHGSFEHQLPLPEDADSGAVNADLKDGVLTIIIKKINKTGNCREQVWQEIPIA